MKEKIEFFVLTILSIIFYIGCIIDLFIYANTILKIFCLVDISTVIIILFIIKITESKNKK